MLGAKTTPVAAALQRAVRSCSHVATTDAKKLGSALMPRNSNASFDIHHQWSPASSSAIQTRSFAFTNSSASFDIHHQWHPASFHYRLSSAIQTRSFAFTPAGNNGEDEETRREVASDLFHEYAVIRNGVPTLDYKDVRELLRGVGEESRDTCTVLQEIFEVADEDKNGLIDHQEFLDHSDFILGGNPGRIVLIVGGPGSGKGVLSKRLEEECHVVHLSSGELLRREVAKGTSLGKQVQQIMEKGELVSSEIMVALMKKRMKDHPGKRVLLDGFPRSPENAQDLVRLCGVPELALHLTCADTVLLERIISRAENAEDGQCRLDDNFDTALERIRTYHRFHPVTMEWLKEQHVPIVNLDCSGPPESVWNQLQAIGRLMRPSVKIEGAAHPVFPFPEETKEKVADEQVWDDWIPDRAASA